MIDESRARSRVPEIVLGLILAVVAVVLLVLALNRPESEQAITPSSAQVGQCLNLGTGEQISLMPADCEDPHDAEIVLVTSAKDVDTESFPDYASNAKICASLLPKDVQKRLFEDRDDEHGLVLTLLSEDVTAITEDDTIVCYATALEGDLEGSLLK